MRIAIIGASGLVGSEMIEVLEELDVKVSKLIPVASSSSVGKSIPFKGDLIPIIRIEDALAAEIDYALFSAGSELSIAWAPRFAEKGITVIDNSSAWRMEKSVPLVVPEVNAQVIAKETRLIANPNCSTIQLVVSLYPLHIKFKCKRLIISSYQSVTGTGKDAVKQLEYERNGGRELSVYPHPIDKNALPHIDVFQDEDYTKEEWKLIKETNKIMESDIAITATTVRLPIEGGHSESVNAEFELRPDLLTIRSIWQNSEGIIVQDDPANNVYPTPLSAYKKNEVFVGRLRRDTSHEKAINYWVVADNLRKGAATNAIQIMLYHFSLTNK